ncbi:non-ribosomal peptide synthetase (plasmid) [Streptomyces sp. NBC_01216]|uniref:non-ribosomal peptide synthetase n=1 Tax=Streptomyces sp. NBC_01216 TaxID=2903778 RepID=UPI002E0E3844|nr:non-ribosomal peptide synthetase [Streptomyces sp. NBC_01216]
MATRYRWRHGDIVARAEELAAEIHATGGEERRVVALECGRGLPSVVALTAALLAGQLPLLGSGADPAGRRERLREVAGAALVVSTSPDGEPLVAPCDAAAAAVAPWPQAVYLAVTSGTIGEPKVAPVSRGVFDSYVRDIQDAYALTAEDRVLQFAPPGFDVFVEEVIPTFRAGATLVVPPWEHAPTGEQFLGFLDAEAVTVVNLPGSYWMGLAEYLRSSGRGLPASVRLVVVGSEPWARTLAEWARGRFPEVKMLNAYGTSEVAPTCFIFDCEDLPKACASVGIIPIGGPLPFVRHEVVPQPDSPHGRLHLAGQPHFGSAQSAIDSGDLASHGADGFVYVHGRADLTRLKRGGVTVNAESLAGAARECYGVLGALARLDRKSGALVLTVQSTGTPDTVARLVSDHLRTVLPPAWLPDRIQVASGLAQVAGTKLSTVSVEVELESLVRAAWSRRTASHAVDPQADFFDTGGDSIGAVRLCAQLSDALAERVPVQLIFANSRFADFVEAVGALLRSRSDRPEGRA